MKYLRQAEFMPGYMQRKMHERAPFVIQEEFFGIPKPIETGIKYRNVKSLLDKERDDFRASMWYQFLIDEIGKCGYARYKSTIMRTEKEVEDFFLLYFFPVVDSLKTSGYKDDEKVVSSVMIDEAGLVHKSGSGNHRFAIAKICGLTAFPVRIVGVHARWIASHGYDGKDFNAERIKNGLREVQSRYTYSAHSHSESLIGK